MWSLLRLYKCLEEELKEFDYNAYYLGEVVYDDETLDFEETFPKLYEALQRFAGEVSGIDSTKAGYVFPPFFQAVTQFKHRGFREENEVRLVASPTPASIIEVAKGILEPDKAVTGKQTKPICVRD